MSSPRAIDLAVARGAHWPKIDTPATRLHRFAAATFALDRLQQHTDAGEAFWIYSAERCIVDAMRLQRIAGRDVALRRCGGTCGATTPIRCD